MIPNAYCEKCDTMEPNDHDHEKDGLWTCNCRVKSKPIDFKKLDEELKKIETKFNKIKN